jgi:hypothetical protein
VHPYDAQHCGALQVGICVTLPLAVLLAIGQPDLAAYAVFGSLSSVYGSRFGRHDRMRAQLGTGAALTLAVVLGTVAGIPGPGSLWAIAAMAVMSVLGLLITRRFGWLPVPSLFLVLATGTISAASHIETGPHKHAIQQTFFLYVWEPGGNRIELCNAGARLILAPDWKTISWSRAERAKGQAWGLKTIESFHTHGTPVIP